MRALQLQQYGDPQEVLRLVELPAPLPGPEEVQIEVHAVGLNPIDYKIAQGKLRLVVGLKLPITLGFDLSGVVLSVGSNVTAFKAGDAVYGRSTRDQLRAFAEVAVLDQRWVAPKPVNLSHLEAASIPLVALTTLQGLTDRAGAKAGQRILILAGSGGVGSFAIQYAKTLGLHVTATTSSRNADFVRELGADRVICYDRETVGSDGAAYDLVYDTLGGGNTMKAFGWLKPGGAVVSIAGPPDADFARQTGAGPLKAVLFALAGAGVRMRAALGGFRYFRFMTESDGPRLMALNALLESGQIRAVVDREFGFDQILDAFAYFMQGRARGKVVVRVR